MAQIEEAFDALIIKNGRITIPRFLLTRHGIENGDRVAFHMIIERPEVKNVETEDDSQSPSVSRTPSAGVQVNDSDPS